MAVIFPETLRPYQLQKAIDYLQDNGYDVDPDEPIDKTGLGASYVRLIADIQNPDSYDDPTQAKVNPCGRCGTTGLYPLSNDTKRVEDTQLIRCGSCEGWGYTSQPVVPIIAWPETNVDTTP